MTKNLNPGEGKNPLGNNNSDLENGVVSLHAFYHVDNPAGFAVSAQLANANIPDERFSLCYFVPILHDMSTYYSCYNCLAPFWPSLRPKHLLVPFPRRKL